MSIHRILLALVAGVLLLLVSNTARAQGPMGMAEAICRNQSQFVQCFSWSLADCQKNASSALQSCQKIMPPRPAAQNTLFREMRDPFGQGQWGLDFGLCGELFLFEKYRDRIKSECLGYFERRTSEARSATFPFKISEALKTESRMRSNLWIQILFVLVPGLLLPNLVATILWRKNRPARFSIKTAGLLMVVSFVGVMIGAVLFARSGLLSEAIGLYGDNPGAIGGTVFGLGALVPSFWISLYLNFRALRAKPLSIGS